jgi:hypothetical protein
MACCESQSLKRMPLLSCISYWAALSVRPDSGFLFYFLFLSQQVRFLTLVLKFTETASFHGGITLASIFVLEGLGRIAGWRKRANLPSSIRQQLRYVWLAFFAGSHIISLFLGNFYGLDTHTYLCVCSTLRSSSSCSSLFYPSGDRKFQGACPLPHTHTKCHWKARSCISWMMTSSIGHGLSATCWGECLLGLGYVVRPRRHIIEFVMGVFFWLIPRS